MKLHLPKLLALAVIAAMASPAFAEWAADSRTGGHAYYYGADASTEKFETLTLPNGSNGISVKNPGYVHDSYASIGLVAGQNGQVITIDTVLGSAGQTFMVTTNPWNTGHVLTANISTLKFADGETAATGGLKVDQNHTATVNAVDGTLANVTNGGTLSLGSADSNTHMAGSIVNTGTFSWAGTFTYDLSDISKYEKISATYTSADPSANGYAETANVTAYAVKSSSHINGDYTFVGFDAEGVTNAHWESNNYVFTKSSTADHVYMVNTGTVNNADVTDAKRFVVANGAILSITNTGTAIIEGSGTVKVTKDGVMRGLTLDDTWSGWVSLTGGSLSGTKTGCDMSQMGQNIEIGEAGYIGWYNDKWNGTMSNNFRLTGTWTNYAFATTRTTPGVFSGTWTGAGTFIAKTDSGKYMDYTYEGDISGWTGEFQGGAGTTLLKLTNNAKTINAAITQGTGQLDLEIRSGSAPVTFNRDVTINNLTIAQSSAFNGALTVKGNITQDGGHSLRIFNAADITGSVTMTNMSTNTDKKVTLKGGATTSAAMFVGGASADVLFTGADKTYSFNSMKTSYLTATGVETGAKAVDRKITVGEGATVNVTNNVEVGWGLSKLTLEDSAKLNAKNVVYGNEGFISAVQMGAGSTIQLGNNHDGTLKTSALTVTGEGATINANLNLTNATVTLNNNSVELGCDVNLTGSTITLTMDEALYMNGVGVPGIVPVIDLFTSADSVTLKGTQYTDDFIMNVTDAGITLAPEIAITSPVFLKYESGTVSLTTVPEPATATLSLLALAALAARRRRH